MIFVFLVFFFATLVLLWYKKIPFYHPHFFSIGFIFLYVVFTYLHTHSFFYHYFPVQFSLYDNIIVQDFRIILSTFFILSYFILLLFTKKHLLEVSCKKKYFSLAKLTFILIFPFSLYFSFNYGWSDINSNSYHIGYSISAHLRNLLLVLLSFIFAGKNSRISLIFLIMFILVSVVDTQRTTLFVAIIMYIIYKKPSFVKSSLLLIILVICMCFIALDRLGDINYYRLFTFPFFAESVFGSYSFSQAVLLLTEGRFNIIQGFYFFLGIPIEIIYNKFIFILKYFGFSQLHFNIESVINSKLSKSGCSEHYSPMGGNFIIADSLFYFNYLGPFVFSVIYFKLFHIFRTLKSQSLKVLLLSCLPLLIKCNFIVFLNFIFVLCTFYFFILVLFSFFKIILFKRI